MLINVLLIIGWNHGGEKLLICTVKNYADLIWVIKLFGGIQTKAETKLMKQIIINETTEGMLKLKTEEKD